MTKPSLKSQQGGTLLVVLMVVTVILVLISVSNLKLPQAAAQNARMANDRRTIQRIVAEGLSCERTLAGFGYPPVCTGQIEVKRNDKSPLIKDTGSQISGWTVRADCGPTGLKILAARLIPGKAVTSTDPADFAKDPLTQQALTFADAHADLYADVGKPPPCKSWFNGTAGPFRSTNGEFYVPPNGSNSVTINTSFKPTSVVCGTAQQNFNNSTNMRCECGWTITGKSVTVSAWHGSSNGGIDCYMNYLITGH